MEVLSIQVGAHIEGLKKGLKNAENQIKSFSKETAKNLNQTGSSTKKLQAGLNKSSDIASLLRSKTKGLSDSFIDVANASKLSGKAMKSALVSSGVGVLLVIVGEIANNWDKISGFISGANEKLRLQKQLNSDITKQLQRQNNIRELDTRFISLGICRCA